MQLLLTIMALAVSTMCDAQTAQNSTTIQENSGTSSTSVNSEKRTNQHQIHESKVRAPRAQKNVLPEKIEKKEAKSENELPDLHEKKKSN